jgi:hypothetical protein
LTGIGVIITLATVILDNLYFPNLDYNWGYSIKEGNGAREGYTFRDS